MGSQDLNQAVRDALMKLINMPAPDAAAINASPEAAAERLQSQRSAEQQQAQAAETASVTGAGNLSGTNQAIRANQAEQDTSFVGQLAATKVAQQIQQMQYALSQAQQAGEFDLAQQLQGNIANLQAMTQRYGIDVGANTAANQLGYNYAALGQNNNQFLDQLGYNYANLNSNNNNLSTQALLHALGLA